MGALTDDFAVNARKPRLTHPRGWEPGFEWNGREGTLISDPISGPETPAFQALMAELGFDPDLHEIVGPIQVRRWQQTPGADYLYYHRATIALRGVQADTDVDALLAEVGKRKPRASSTLEPSGGAGFFIGLCDWQIGKSDGDGVEGTIARLAELPDKIEARVRALRKAGVPIDVIYPGFIGDLKESCHGHYAQQAFRTVLNNRDQRKVIRTCAEAIIDRCATLARTEVKAVGGNHGEEREAGKSNTDFADNVDVAVIEDIAYAYSLNPDRYANVGFALPNADLTLTFDHQGTIIGMAHGHQAGFGAGDPRAKIHNWWKGQMDGQQPIGDADVLVTGHFHHPWMIQRGARTHFGCPAMDGGSDWFRNTAGVDAPPGTLTFVVDSTGWHSMEIL